MTTDAAPTPWLSRLKTALGPRGGLALVAAGHLMLTALQSHPLFHEYRSVFPAPRWYDELALLFVPIGIDWAQTGLIAAVAVLGCGRWYLRWPRSILLAVWLVVAEIVGSWLLDGQHPSPIFEESLMFTGLHLAIFAVTLTPLRLLTGRKFDLPTGLRTPRFQFRLIHLLLLTGELALLMGLVRALVLYNPRWRAEVWHGIRQLPQFEEWGMLIVLVLSVAPAIVAAAWPYFRFRIAACLALYELALAVTASLLHGCGIQWLPYAWSHPPTFANLFLESLAICSSMFLTAATTIWFTFCLVRWFGYDFLPLPRRGGRQSSEATSAA